MTLVSDESAASHCDKQCFFMFLLMSGNPWLLITLNRTPSSPWAFNSHSSSGTVMHSFNRSNVMCHVYEVFVRHVVSSKPFTVSVSTLSTLNARMCPLHGNMHKHIWQHAIQVLGEQKKGHFLAHQI